MTAKLRDEVRKGQATTTLYSSAPPAPPQGSEVVQDGNMAAARCAKSNGKMSETGEAGAGTAREWAVQSAINADNKAR